MTRTTIVKDPVCGMDVEMGTATERTEHTGQTYYFCSSSCKDKFDRDPQQFLGKLPGTPKSGPGCCA